MIDLYFFVCFPKLLFFKNNRPNLGIATALHLRFIEAIFTQQRSAEITVKARDYLSNPQGVLFSQRPPVIQNAAQGNPSKADQVIVCPFFLLLFLSGKLSLWAGMIKKKEDTGNNFSVSSLSIGVISVEKAFCSLLYLFKVGINHIIVGFSFTLSTSSHFRAATRFLPGLFLRGLRIHDLSQFV